MLGKTFKGMTDEMLAWQTERLLALETHREGHVVHVRPELVVEIAFDGVQTSTRYPGGVALRFARVKGYRPDKPVSEADTDRPRARDPRGPRLARHAAAVYAASASAGSPPAGDTGSTKTSAGRRRGSRMRSWRRTMAPTTSAAPACWPNVRCSPRKSAASASPAGTSTVTRSDAVPAPTRRIPARNALTAKTLPTSAPTSTPETPTHPPTATISPVEAPNTGTTSPRLRGAAAAKASGIDVAEQAIRDEDVRRVGAGRREGESDSDGVGVPAATDEHDAEQDADEGRRPPRIEPLAAEERGCADDHDEMRVVKQRRERRRGAVERGVEERGIGRIQHDPEAEGERRDAGRDREQPSPGDDGENGCSDRVSPAEQRRDRRPAVERQLSEDGLDREGDRPPTG